MQTMILAAAALSLAVIGSAFAGEGNGPDYPAYNAGIAQLRSHEVFGTGPNFAGPRIRVQANVAGTGSSYGPQFTGQAAQTPDVANLLAQGSQHGSQG